MTYLTADQWIAVLHKYRKACQRITIQTGKLTRAQWATLGRITDLAQETAIDDKPRDRHGRTDDRPEWARRLFPGNTPNDVPCPHCDGQGSRPVGSRLTGRGLDSWHDAPEYEYAICDYCAGSGWRGVDDGYSNS